MRNGEPSTCRAKDMPRPVRLDGALDERYKRAMMCPFGSAMRIIGPAR